MTASSTKIAYMSEIVLPTRYIELAVDVLMFVDNLEIRIDNIRMTSAARDARMGSSAGRTLR